MKKYSKKEKKEEKVRERERERKGEGREAEGKRKRKERENKGRLLKVETWPVCRTSRCVGDRFRKIPYANVCQISHTHTHTHFNQQSFLENPGVLNCIAESRWEFHKLVERL